jgi:hypothetical protein
MMAKSGGVGRLGHLVVGNIGLYYVCYRLSRLGWSVMPEDRYRYHAIDEGSEIRIKIVIGEYLATEVIWSD